MSRSRYHQTKADLDSLEHLKRWNDQELWQEIEEGEKACGLNSDMSATSKESFLHNCQRKLPWKIKIKMDRRKKKTDHCAENDKSDEAGFQALMKRIEKENLKPVSEEDFDRRSSVVSQITRDPSGILRYGLVKKVCFLKGEEFCPKKTTLFTKRRRGPKIQTGVIKIKSRSSLLERDDVLNLAEEAMKVENWTEEFLETITPSRTAGKRNKKKLLFAVQPEEVKKLSTTHRPILHKKRIKVLIAAAAAGITILGGTMVASGKREYHYEIYPIIGKQNLVMKSNAVLDIADDLENAYQRIENELKIPVLVLGHIPDGMAFKNLTMERNITILEFKYQNKYIYLREEKKIFSQESSQSILSDRIPYAQVYNKFLNKNIAIEKNELQNDLIEYSARIDDSDAEYYLSGMIEGKEFIAVAEGLMFK